MHPAVFLDRDGVIIENRDAYVRSWADVEIYPQALSALARLSTSRFKIIIVTNQSAVGRGIISLEAAEAINRQLVHEIERTGGRVDGVFMCPHAPSDGCQCRKPLPGLLIQAANVLQLDLTASYLIGDAITDIQAGQAAGVHQAILVHTGRGYSQASHPKTSLLKPFLTCNSLEEALNCLLTGETP
jgi:D-glycero-D-manno-heptose 1,7-bisphosphate phosphatase